MGLPNSGSLVRTRALFFFELVTLLYFFLIFIVQYGRIYLYKLTDMYCHQSKDRYFFTSYIIQQNWLLNADSTENNLLQLDKNMKFFGEQSLSVQVPTFNCDNLLRSVR